jgi:hypothetical protein
MSGWIKIHRDIARHWIFHDAEKFKWWIDLLLLASFEDNKALVGDRLVEVKRGQQIASLSFLSKRWNKAKGTVLKFLELLESDHMIERYTDRKVTILTICNYESYQEVDKQTLTDVVNDSEPMTDRCLTELKNVEECKEIYNTNSARTHEERVSWDSSAEQGYYQTFKGKGAQLPLSKVVGKSAHDVLLLLDVYMADREVKNKGHKNYSEFVSLFKWHLENGKIKLPDAPQQKKSKNILEMYG